MMTGILFIVFIFFLIVSMPVAFAMGASGAFSILLEGSTPLVGAISRVFSGMNSMSMLAIPFFLLSGQLMDSGGISKRLVNFAKSLVGHLPGGLAHVSVLSSMIFASVSGSSIASAMAFGTIMIPAMNKAGYDKGFTATIQACGGCLGPIIPPSIVMIMYCSITGLSVGKLFLYGIVPGIMLGIGFMIVSYLYARKAHIPTEKRQSLGTVWSSFKEAVWALFMPIIIVGGIISGFFTATEAGMIAVIYGVLVGRFVYKELKWRDLPVLLANAAKNSAQILFLCGLANIFGWQLARLNFPSTVMNLLASLSSNPLIIILLVILFFTFIGCFMDTAAAIVVFVPVVYPLAVQFGIDPIHFALVVCMTLVFGQVTPPVGVLLYLTAGMNEIPIQRTFRYLVPCLITMFIVLFLVSYVPQVAMLLPNLVFGT